MAIIHKERLFLIDGSALAYRAYFTFISRPLRTSKGENTSAVFGFTNVLLKILDKEKPDHLAVVFDRPEPTFRHKIYKPYKATRQKMPEDMILQLERLREVIKAFNVPILEISGYEADDIMGTIAKKAEKENIETFLVTSDKDFMQLISPLIKILKPGKSGNEWEIIDFEHVKKKFGVTPDKVVEVLGLTGDKSDNIPGVAGIGETTAVPLVLEFGSIENIYNNIDHISKETIKNKLLINKENAFLSKQLVTIKTDIPLDIDIHTLCVQERDIEKLYKLFNELEFKLLIQKLDISKNNLKIKNSTSAVKPSFIQDISTDQHNYFIIRNENELQLLIKRLKSTDFFVFDTETTSTDPIKAELIGLSFCIKPTEAFYIPIKHSAPEISTNNKTNQKSLFDNLTSSEKKAKSSPYLSNNSAFIVGFDCNTVLTKLSNIFSDENITKCGQNLKYDIIVLANHGIKIKGQLFDTMVASYILRPDGKHNLDALAIQHLNYRTIRFDELVGNEDDIRKIPLQNISNYSSEDSDITFRLYEILRSKLIEHNLIKLCQLIEFPLIYVLAQMELTGIKIDLSILQSMSNQLENLNKKLVQEIYDLAGKPFNINSTKQLSKILFEDLKLPSTKKTKSGFSTNVSVLEDLVTAHPIIEKLLEYRTYTKLKSTYLDTLSSLINPKTGRIHTSFNQTITTTGRLSSSNPNLQNIPIRTDVGKAIRKAFVPVNSDWKILSADYSQIELRVMAHISGDVGLREAFRNGEDIHSTTAAKIFGVDVKDVSKDMRRKAKEVNFGIMYGLGVFGLANRLQISQNESKEIIEKYHNRFPKVKLYIQDTIQKARSNGYVETLLGRRRYLPDINSRNQSLRSNAERQAINMPIQGTAADMIKLAMIKIYNATINDQDKIRLLLQVHDELVFEVAQEYCEKAKYIITEMMKSALPLDVPIEIEIGWGNNWFEAH